jgi:hypothetical protein
MADGGRFRDTGSGHVRCVWPLTCPRLRIKTLSQEITEELLGLQLSGAVISDFCFSSISDWGRFGGTGGEAFPVSTYNPSAPNVCPSSPSTPFYISIDGQDPPGTLPDESCVRNYCGGLDGDKRENCIG